MGLLAKRERANITTIDVTQTDTLTNNEVRASYEIVDLAPSWHGQGRYRGGMGIPAAWRAATMLADLVGGLTWDAYTDDENDLAVKVRPRPPVLVRPAPPRPLITTAASLALDYLWHGNGVAVKVGYDAFGNTSSIIPVNAESAFVRQVMPGDHDIPFPVGTIAYALALAPGLPQLWYSADEVMHLMGPSEPWALRGMGVLENHLATLDLAREQSRQAVNATGSGVPTGVLSSDNPDLTPDEANDISSTWMEKQRDRKVAVLNATTHYEALAWSPTDAQLVEARGMTMHEIALVFGLDPTWLGVVSTGSNTYANVEQQGINLLRYGGPSGLLSRFEAGFTDLLAPGSYAKANLDALLRNDTLTRYQAHALAFGKWMTGDEIRRVEDMPPMTAAQKAEIVPPAPAGPPPGAPGHKAPAGAGTPGKPTTASAKP